MSNPGDNPRDSLLQMDLQPSALLRGTLVLCHLFAMFALWWSAAPALLQWAAMPALALSCLHGFLRQSDFSGLHLRSGEILLRRNNQMISVMITSAPWCTEWLQVLRFAPIAQSGREADDGGSGRAPLLQRLGRHLRQRYAQRRMRVVILPDSASAQSRRRLRVLLRWHRFSGGVPA